MSHDRAVGIARARHVRADEYKSRIVCARCHDIITDTIESPARPVLKRLLDAGPRLVGAHDKRVLAAWGAKTACTQWGMMQRSRGVPLAHRRTLLARGEPHPSVYVAYARLAGGSVRTKFARTEIALRESGRKLWVYEFLFAFDTVAVKVYGPGDGRAALDYKETTSMSMRVWPPTDEESRWPPGRVHDDEGFDDLWEFDPRRGRTSR